MSRRIGRALALSLCWVALANAAEKKQLLLIGQQRDNHPATTHEFLPGLRVLAATLAKQPEVAVRIVPADGAWPEGPELIRNAAGIVLYVSEGAKWLAADPRRQDAVAQLAARGGGLSALHWGIGCRDAQYIESFAKLFGGCHGGPDRRYQVVAARLTPADSPHPVARGLTPLVVRDEFYYRLKQPPGGGPRPLLTALIDGQEEMVSWTWQRHDGGRSFGFSGLHFHDNWKQEFYRRLVTQGVLWTLKLEIPAPGVEVAVDEAVFELE